MVVPVVETGTGLASDGERVFEASGGDKGDARAFAFEQRIGGDGGAVANFDHGCAGTDRDLFDGVEDRAGWISGVEGSLSTSRLPAVAIDAIGERAACIDGDGEALGHFTANISGAGCNSGVVSLRFLLSPCLCITKAGSYPLR